VHFACNNAPTVVPQIKAGALRGMFAMPGRLPEIPEVPSAREAGFPDMEKIVGWTALLGPPGLPKEVVDRWVDVFGRLAKDPDWQTGNTRIGGIAAIRSPADTEKFVREQYELYDKLVGALGIRQ
jgi:tripartite-type tricarboxylate transporter receptor subunit TctC